MKRYLFLILIFFTSQIFASDILFYDLPKVVSSTALTQDITTEYNPDIEVFTAKDIKLFGVENIPDLFSLFPGVNMYRSNTSTVNIGIRGFSALMDASPTVLIDGQEVEDRFLTKQYFYNLPITIEDIDRIEVVKGPSFYSDSFNSPAGLINIVTKSPELLGANYVTGVAGSESLRKFNFSINRFIAKTYFKLTGEIRGIDDYNRTKRDNKNKFINLTATKFIGENSLIYMKLSYTKSYGVFKSDFMYEFFYKPMTFPYQVKAENAKNKTFFISYKYPSFEASLYYAYNRAYIKTDSPVGAENSIGKSDFYKFNIKKSINVAKNDITLGFESRFSKLSLGMYNKSRTENYIFYVKDKFDFSKNVTLKALIKNDKPKDYGKIFTYFFSGDIHPANKKYGINFSYSKSVQLLGDFYKYFNFKMDLPKVARDAVPINVKDVEMFSNKNLKAIKVYSTNLTFYYSNKNFTFNTKLYYNRFKDMVSIDGNVDFSDLFNPSITFKAENNYGLIVHGFETDVKYKFSRYLKLYASYYLQQSKIKGKVADYNHFSKYFMMPKYRIISGLIFKNSYFSGSLFVSNMPKIEQIAGSSDDYTEVDLTLNKNFYKNKLECIFRIRNLLNNVHREKENGLNIDRGFFVKVKYNF